MTKLNIRVVLGCSSPSFCFFHSFYPTLCLQFEKRHLLGRFCLQSLQDLEDDGDMLQDLQTRRQQRKEEVKCLLIFVGLLECSVFRGKQIQVKMVLKMVGGC